MTKLLEKALEAARHLPPDEQDEIARVIIELAGGELLPPVSLSQDERDAIARSRSVAARGEFATDEQIQTRVVQARLMKLRYTAPALADLESILDYVSETSPHGAARIHARIRAITELLSRHPLAGVRTDDPTIRRMATTPYPYVIFYELLARIL